MTKEINQFAGLRMFDTAASIKSHLFNIFLDIIAGFLDYFRVVMWLIPAGRIPPNKLLYISERVVSRREGSRKGTVHSFGGFMNRERLTHSIARTNDSVESLNNPRATLQWWHRRPRICPVVWL